jgi:NADH-quinone oxidoreductase subunit L
MGGPMLILAMFSLIGGFYGIPGIEWIQGLLDPVVGPAVALAAWSVNFWISLILGLAFALGGIAIAWMRYGARQHQFRTVHSPLHTFLSRRWYIDDVYDWVVVRPIMVLGRASSRVVEAFALDGGTRGVGWVSARLSAGFRTLQTGYVRNYALAILLGAVVILLYYAVRF